MVFENLTLFEFQLDGAQFGPRSLTGDDVTEAAVEETDMPESELTTEESGSRLFPMVFLALVAIGAAVIWRRSRGSDVEMELDAEDAEDAESDLAAAQ